MIDFSKPVKTVGGKKVTIYAVDFPNETYPIVGSIEGRPIPSTWTVDGKFTLLSSNNDLVQDVPVQDVPEFFINVYRSRTSSAIYTSLHTTREQADTMSNKFGMDRIAVAHVKEGDGL